MEDAKQRFTVLTIEENIDEIVIVSNNDLIVITDNRAIYNLGRFKFVLKFKELKAKGDDISLKNDFGEVVVTKLENYSSIEQYGNMIISNNDKQL